MESEDNYNNKIRQNLNKKALYYKHGKALYDLNDGQLHNNIIAVAKNSTNPIFETINKEQDVVYLLSILLSVCVEKLPGPKVDPHLYTLQIFPLLNPIPVL
mmetsp:Transcript_40073/g.43480  ORF Transcript_40073/g.43480 Transcript_40073/m.43480 type:complete len:101 (+) Transcript_40073:1-303(+)